MNVIPVHGRAYAVKYAKVEKKSFEGSPPNCRRCFNDGPSWAAVQRRSAQREKCENRDCVGVGFYFIDLTRMALFWTFLPRMAQMGTDWARPFPFPTTSTSPGRLGGFYPRPSA